MVGSDIRVLTWRNWWTNEKGSSVHRSVIEDDKPSDPDDHIKRPDLQSCGDRLGEPMRWSSACNSGPPNRGIGGLQGETLLIRVR